MITALLPRVFPDRPGWTYFYNETGHCVNAVFGSPQVHVSLNGRWCILMKYDDKETIIYADRWTIASDGENLPNNIKFDKGEDPWVRDKSYAEMATE